MVSIPDSTQGVDINYKSQQRDGGHTPFSPVGSPSCSFSSWEESMLQLSRGLQTICRSPDSNETPVFPLHSPGSGNISTSGPASPSPKDPILTSSAGSLSLKAELGKMLNVRHVQSEEKLREKLTYICRSPRRRERSSTSSSSEEDNIKLRAAKAAKTAKKKTISSSPFFKARIDIGNHTIEDLSVSIEDHKLKVVADKKEVSGKFTFGELPVDLNLPPEVNPQKLICIVRDGFLEVKESVQRKCVSTNKMFGRQLSMSYTSAGIKANNLRMCQDYTPDECPIVIEDDGSHLLKLVLRVPPVYKFNDLQIKTVDNQLIVTGRQGPQRSLSASFSPSNWNKENQDGEDQFCKVFELPSSVDPFSITARLTDNHQLVIQATLSPRARSSTL